MPSTPDPHPVPSRIPIPTPATGPARTAVALEAADRLTRTTVAITDRLSHRVPPGLARTLREAAVLAHAGTTAACRAPDPVRALRGVNATDQSLQRLGVWLDLARRFGDLPPDEARELEAVRGRLRVVLSVLADGWRTGCRPTRTPASWGQVELHAPRRGHAEGRKSDPENMALNVNVAMRYGTRNRAGSGGRQGGHPRTARRRTPCRRGGAA